MALLQAARSGVTDRALGSKTSITIVVALYVLLLLTSLVLSSSIYLYSAGLVDSHMTASEIMLFASSGFSTIYIILHQLMARWHLIRRGRHNMLRSACFAIARLMVISWMAASGVGLVVAVRQPTCFASDSRYGHWQAGIGCIIHRASVAASLVAFIAACALLCSLEIPGRPFQASLTGIAPPDATPARPIPPLNPSLYSFVSDKSLYPASIDLEQGRLSRPMMQPSPGSAKWQHGRTPVLPPLPRRSFSLDLALPEHLSDLFPRQSIMYPATAHVPIPPATVAPSISADTSNLSSSARIDRRPSVISSKGSSCSSSSRQSPLSTMHRADEPEVPIIPDRFRPHRRPPLVTYGPHGQLDTGPARTLTMPASIAHQHSPAMNMTVPSAAVIRKSKSAIALQQRHRHAQRYRRAAPFPDGHHSSSMHHQNNSQYYTHRRPSLPHLESYESLRKGLIEEPPAKTDTLLSAGYIYGTLEDAIPYERLQAYPPPFRLLPTGNVEVPLSGGRPITAGDIRRKKSRTLVKHRQPCSR